MNATKITFAIKRFGHDVNRTEATIEYIPQSYFSGCGILHILFLQLHTNKNSFF